MKKKLSLICKPSFFVWLLGLSLITPSSLWSAVDPHIEWKTLSTPHFEIVFDAKHYETAKKYALRLEFNHSLLKTYYQEWPEKTVVVLNDNTDLANGYATPIPYFHIVLYPVLPSSHDTISEYSDWPQELTLHEYTHILNFTPAHGIMGFLRSGLGSIIVPTILLPRWWHEGVAVEMETRFSTHGRLRSIYQDATLRALVKAEQLQRYSIADINESDLDTWPRGGRPYLFGSILLSEIQSQKGKTINNILLQRYSRRVPYFNDAPTEEETDRSFEEWFQEAKHSLTQNVQSQLTKIREEPPSEMLLLSADYQESHSPQFSPDGRYFTFVARNKWGKSSIQIFDRKEENRIFDIKKDSISEFLSIDNKSTEEKKDAPPPGNINRITWLPNSTGFIFDQVRFVNSYSNYSDLFYYDLANKKTKRLTTGLRLREPSLSPDGIQIAAVQLWQSNTQLVTVSFDGSKLEIIYTPPAFHKIANPFFTDSQTLYFTERTLQGEILLQKINLATKELTPVNLTGIKQINALNAEAGGVSFIARENGMQNLYWSDNLFQSQRRLTHTETAVFDGSIDPRTKTVYTTVMTDSGPQVASSPWPTVELKTPPPLVTPLFQSRYGENPQELPSDATLEKEFGSLLSEPEPYSSLNYLRPRYWLPFIYSNESGYGFQISTSAFDPLDKHNYGLDLNYDSYTQETKGTFSYGNNTTTWPMDLLLTSQTRKQPLLNTTYEAQQMNFLATHDLIPWSENMTVGLGFDGMMTKVPAVKKKLGPQLVYVYDGAAKSIYSNTPFAGYQFSILGNHYVKTSELTHLVRGLAKLSYYYSGRLPDRHIASVHLMAQEMKGELSLADYSSSNVYNLAPNMLFPGFVLRGYDNGYFYIKNARSGALEYTFPLTGPRGWGTLPAFLKKTYLNLYAEILMLDGISSNLAEKSYDRAYLKNSFRSYGVELKGDITLGYYIPLTVLVAAYHRPDYTDKDKTSLFFGLQL